MLFSLGLRRPPSSPQALAWRVSAPAVTRYPPLSVPAARQISLALTNALRGSRATGGHVNMRRAFQPSLAACKTGRKIDRATAQGGARDTPGVLGRGPATRVRGIVITFLREHDKAPLLRVGVSGLERVGDEAGNRGAERSGSEVV